MKKAKLKKDRRRGGENASVQPTEETEDIEFRVNSEDEFTLDEDIMDNGGLSSQCCMMTDEETSRGTIADYWQIDSGCTVHMSGDREIFTKLRESSTTSVTMADGGISRVEGEGTARIVTHDLNGNEFVMIFEKVLYVPALTHGFISV